MSLEWVGSHLIVVFNNRLERLDGLDSLVHVGGYLRVKLNPGLYSCIALSRLLDIHDDGPPGPQSGAVPDVGGIVEFEDNLSGCNALEEVTAAATVVIGSIASGAWHNPEIPGQGMFISTWPASREIFLMWSTFDTAHADRGQRWLTAHGNWVGNRGQLSLYSTGGGVFNSSLLVPNSEVVGRMWLEFSSPDVAAAAYELPDLGLRGVIPLRRIR